MSKTFIGGAVCREFESEAPAAEEMLDMQQRTVSSVFRCALNVVMVVELLVDENREFQSPDSWCSDTESLGLKVDPCRRLIE